MNFLFIAIIILCVVMTVKNVFTIARLKKEKQYVSAYTAMLKEHDDALENLNKYLETEKNSELISKSNIVKVYLEAKRDLDTEETIEKIDLKSVFLDSKGNTKKMLERNCDAFLWLIYDLVMFHSKEKYQEIEKINNLVKEYDSALNNRVEYKVFCGTYNALKKDYYIDQFLKDLINGDYVGVEYDKKLIGLFKRISAMILDYRKEPLDSFYKEDLGTFSQTLVGKIMMKDLGMYDNYKPVEENKDEVKEEPKEIEEKKEEDNN